ncbi:MAG: hypothetical protein GEU79_08000 [Acidimicrobiia bacterium]|nr:hypothetical protein [Acidimicrobiia bacterium]
MDDPNVTPNGEPVPTATITSLDIHPLALPLRRPISSALGTYTDMNCVLVYVHTDDGPSGCGFTMGLGGAWSNAVATYIRDELAPLAIGGDALRPEALWDRLWGRNKARMRAGLGVWALSAVDIACWDIVGKVADLPVNNLLGGHRQEIPVYGSGGWHELSDEELLSECRAYAEQGISAYKYKIGTDRDRERTAFLRKEMGDDFVLLADANQKYNVREAIEVSRMLADYAVTWIEEPVAADSVHDMAEVSAAGVVPVAAGENVYFRWGFRDLCMQSAAAYLQPDVARCGGITEFRKISTLAEAFTLNLSSHLCHELSLSLVGASPRGWMVEYTELLPADLFTNPFEVVNGSMSVPEDAGHGVDFVPEAVTRFSR